MARAITVTMMSDKSGVEIPSGTGARVRVLFNDHDRIDMRADLTDEEIAKLVRDYKFKEVEPRPNRAGEKRNRPKRVTL